MHDPTSLLAPLSVFLVRRGGTGDRVLFRYPFAEPKTAAGVEDDPADAEDFNPFVLRDVVDDVDEGDQEQAERTLSEDNLISFSSKVLSSLFALGEGLCDEKFELRVDNVRFVGHGVSLEFQPGEGENYYRFRRGLHDASTSMFHIVFALRSSTAFSVARCYYELSKAIGIAVRYEERRVGYLFAESKIMLNAQDEVNSGRADPSNAAAAAAPPPSTAAAAAAPAAESSSSGPAVSPFALILERSQLARDLKRAFHDISNTGIVQLHVNGWIEVSYCMPQKVHKRINANLFVEPDAVIECMNALRPYHSLLLLQDAKELAELMPLDCNSAIKSILKEASPSKSITTLAADTGISKNMVFNVTGHLLHWGMATVIYPLCSTNVYVISPTVPNPTSRELVDRFGERFSGESLARYLALFSTPNSLNKALPPIAPPAEVSRLAEVVVWFLQHHLLVQLHTYITLALGPNIIGCSLEDPLRARKRDAKEQRNRQRQRRANSIGAIRINAADGGNSNGDPAVVGGATAAAAAAASSAQDDLDAPFVTDSGHVLRTIREPDRGRRLRLLNSRTREQILALFSSEEERAALAAVPAAEHLDDLRFFARVAPYFTGRYHVEDIMYHEDIRRAQLMTVVDKFRQVLVKQEAEDPAITAYFKKSIVR